MAEVSFSIFKKFYAVRIALYNLMYSSALVLVFSSISSVVFILGSYHIIGSVNIHSPLPYESIYIV